MRVLTVFFLSLLSFCAVAGKDTLCWSLTAHYGFIMPHHESMKYVITSHIPAAEFSVYKRTTGKKEWERSFHYPDKGLSAIYINLMNAAEAGNAFALAPYVNHPLCERGSFRLNLKTAIGIGVLTRHFDRLENHKNNIIGSALNGYVQLLLSGSFQTFKHGRTDAGIGFTHFSNGAYTMPNLGYNFVSVNLGYGLTRYPQSKNTEPVSPPDKKIHFWLRFLGGVNEAMPPGGKKYFPHLISFNAVKKLGHVSTLSLGLEVLNNPANIKKYEAEDIYITYGQNFQAGIKIGHEVTIGPTSLVVETGAYFYDPYAFNGLMFHRIGVHHQFNEKWTGLLTLRTHWARADNFEIGIGYKIK